MRGDAHVLNQVNRWKFCEEVARGPHVRSKTMRPTDNDELTPYRVIFTDGYYSVRQATSKEHARELSAERHPDRVVESVEMLR